MDDYNSNLEKPFGSYLDANNLCGHAMSRPLPYRDFKWVEPLPYAFIMNDKDDNDIGYTLEVDLEYPEIFRHIMIFTHIIPILVKVISIYFLTKTVCINHK